MQSMTEPSQTTADQHTGDALIGSPFPPLLVNGFDGPGSHMPVDTSALRDAAQPEPAGAAPAGIGSRKDDAHQRIRRFDSGKLAAPVG
jgi:hypothetical protein